MSINQLSQEDKHIHSGIHHHHHHHHSHHRELDDSEVFKNYQLREQRRWKLLKQGTFYFLVLVAILVVLTVYYVYTHE